MEEHPTELLPGYVLEALSAEESRLVEDHLRRCQGCRAEAASFRAVVDLLPYTAPAQDPPEHVKRQLFARINALEEPRAVGRPQHGPPLPRPPQARPAQARLPRWAAAALAGACALVLGLSAATYETTRRLHVAEAALIESTPSDPNQMSALLAAPDTQPRDLHTAVPGLQARMFLRPGHRKALLIISGLPAPAAGHVYQFWFARGSTLVAARQFDSGRNGAVALVLDAPDPVDSYRQVMVTQEPGGGGGAPSTDVVLEASL
jgi:hypothetical protein